MRSVVLLLLLGGLASAADQWPQFRGPHGDGTGQTGKLPESWSETSNIRWKTAIHGKGWSSPVIWDDQIWMTTADETMAGKEVAHVDFFAVCVDRKTGKVLHDIKLFSEDKPAFCHPFNSYASPTPVIEAGGSTFTLAATARPAWIPPRAKFSGSRRNFAAITSAGLARPRSCIKIS
jgi:hypothetical protein